MTSKSFFDPKYLFVNAGKKTARP